MFVVLTTIHLLSAVAILSCLQFLMDVVEDSQVPLKKMCDFSTLPPHILTNVLTYLKLADLRNAVQTCKSLYYASHDLKIANKLRVRNPSKLANIECLARPITTLQLYYPNMNKFRYRDLLRNFGRTITELEVLGHMSMPRLFELFIHLPNVKTLKLYDSSKITSTLNFLRCRKMGRHRRVISNNIGNIRNLMLHVSARNLDLYKMFLDNCTNIQKFSWFQSGVHAIDKSDFINTYLLNPAETRILENAIELVIHNVDGQHKIFESLACSNLFKLRTLNLSDISINYYDPMFKAFCRQHKGLDEFGLSACSERHLYDICQYMRKLKSLEIENCNADKSLLGIKNMAKLEHLHVERRSPPNDVNIIKMLNLRLERLTSLSLDNITADLLKAICEYKNLETLILMAMQTYDCEPIFRNLFNLRTLTLEFTEFVCHSSRIRSSPVWNITRLKKLEELFVDCFVPGITPALIKQLPRVNLDFLADVYDPTDEELAEESCDGHVVQPANEEPRYPDFDLTEYHNIF